VLMPLSEDDPDGRAEAGEPPWGQAQSRSFSRPSPWVRLRRLRHGRAIIGCELFRSLVG
jgi:hypothetical protein